MLSDNLKERINLQWEKYNSEEKSVPKIVAMIPTKDAAWAQFKTNDLYSGRDVQKKGTKQRKIGFLRQGGSGSIG